ncbi:hypothetical protein RND71_036435 [Anisodus tanguticus]|uniref:VWFA domain-containing protein n=1 Tax=Anisodus tanguticus TaxID=243964 RepID=A0AAE1R1N3_9SOLA|nr:hypothetical protein RND71_036435 [Anisodus tanguticus]
MADQDEFVKAVEDGLRLSKRIYFGKDRAVVPPKPMTEMEKAAQSYFPTSPMMYAVIENPAFVDNSDIPSYQPHVHGRCDPPALIPLQMNGVSLLADCYYDTAFITVTGSWRLHCVMSSRSVDCRIAVPMGEQGSILGVDVELPRKSYSTKLVAEGDERETKNLAKIEDGCFLKPHIFTLKIPEIDGGTYISVTIRWSQKLLYHDGQFTLSIPYSFPDYVTPSGKKMSKKEKIQFNVNCDPGTEVSCKPISHPLKELEDEDGTLGLFYEANVLNWSSSDVVITYKISSPNYHGSVLLQSPQQHDTDQRKMFCCYLFPGAQECRKVFRKEVIFVVDISGSMKGKPIDNTKQALSVALSKLDSEDLFNIIAFNSEEYLFSSSLGVATKEAIDNAIQWIDMNFIPGGGTNILNPLKQAVGMLSNAGESMPIIFLVTDGAVEDERQICEFMKSHLTQNRTMCPRLYTFGIGLFCNHYFLRTLAMMSHGHYDAAFDVESLEVRLERLFSRASSIILANIAFDNLDGLEELEVYPSQIPDLSSEGPIIVSGRYQGAFPEMLKAKGILANMSNFPVELKGFKSKAIPLDKIRVKQQIEILTAQAWFTENKDLEQKIAKMSIQDAVVSEYTRMALVETKRVRVIKPTTKRKVYSDDEKIEERIVQKTILLHYLGFGFGNLTATIGNIPPGAIEIEDEAAEIIAKATSNCCGKLCGLCCCCSCCIRTCSKMNHQCAIALTQFLGKILILLRDGREFLGTFRSFDQHANIVLEGTSERVMVGNLYCDIPLGLYIVRGENVMLIGERAQKADKDAALKGGMRRRMEFLDFD